MTTILGEITEIKNFIDEYSQECNRKIATLKQKLEKLEKHVRDTTDNIFAYKGELSPDTEEVSVSKQELSEFFGTNTNTMSVYDYKCIFILEDALSHFEPEHVFTFKKEELILMKYASTEIVSTTRAMELLDKRILDSSSKDDSVIIIKTYICLMSVLQSINVELYESTFPGIRIPFVMDWVKRTLNQEIEDDQYSTGFALYKGNTIGLSSGRPFYKTEIKEEWPIGTIFLSTVKLDDRFLVN